MKSQPLRQDTPDFETRALRWFFFFFLSNLLASNAATVSLSPVADTTLAEIEPNNNMGAQIHFNVGTTLNFTRNHGLIRFDIASQIPAGSKIKSAQLVLEVVGFSVDTPANDEVDLHRVLKPWGEGNKSNPGSPGRGQPATTNEATWLDRFAFTTNAWEVPGGGATNDYATVVSAARYVVLTDQSPYYFGPTSQLVADVQSWLDNPGSNYGWLLKPNDESTPGTARRIGSREDLLNSPSLDIEFVPPPEILGATADHGEFIFSFQAEASQPYAVEFKNTLSPSEAWGTLTNIQALAETQTVIISNTISQQRFFRIKAL